MDQYRAARTGDLRWLKNNKHDVNMALTTASYWGREDIVTEMMRDGANINIISTSSQTVLMFACIGGYLGIVTKLIGAGADLDIQDCGGNTAL